MWNVNELKDKIATGIFSNKKRKGAVAGQKTEGEQQVEGFEFFLETEHLLSRFLGDPTVGIRRDKKESRSTHRGLCVGSGFEEFRQTS